MAKSVVRLNAKGKVIKDYVKWGVMADTVKYGIPIAYVATQFNIFTTNDARVQIGGGAILLGFIGWTFFRSKIKLAVEKYKKGSCIESEIIVAKNKDGETGSVTCQFNPNLMHFSTPDERHTEGPEL